MTITGSMTFTGDMYLLGLIPAMLSPHDPRPAVEQLHEGYAHGGGWHDFEGFVVTELLGNGPPGLYSIKYPGDPAYKERGRITLVNAVTGITEKIVVFDHGWVMVVQPDGKHRIARMD